MTIKSKAEGLRARSQHYAARAEASREDHGSVDAVYAMVARDGDVGGGIMAGSLAYRLFIWLLPFSLVVIGGIGIGADAASESPASAARSLGLRGLVASSVAEAAQASSRWYAIAIGIPILFWATRGLLRAVVVVHRLVWSEPRSRAPKTSVGAMVRFLVLLLGYFLVRELAVHVLAWTGSIALRTVVGLAGTFVWWMFVSARLPHGGATRRALVPGAIVVAVGLELISALGSYLIATRVDNSQSAYGVLGVAAGLLFGLYLVSRLIVASAIVNATFCERRKHSAEIIRSE